MTKILFVCHGNICRSPTAEYMLRDMVETLGLGESFYIASAATSTEELGNGVYPPSRRLLEEHGIDCSGKTARQIVPGDYDRFDMIIGMDAQNMRALRRIFSPDREGKLSLLLDHAGRQGEDIYDPWYSRDFRRSWDDIRCGCLGLLDELLGGEVVLDFSSCVSRGELYAVMRREMLWQDDYGENLDALWDILTALPHRGRSFRIILPRETESEAGRYARRVRAVFDDAAQI